MLRAVVHDSYIYSRAAFPKAYDTNDQSLASSVYIIGKVKYRSARATANSRHSYTGGLQILMEK